ncbi:MAG: hypothetical protein M0C28_03100 [Candidatus Moduliflexus flocculans]|nr:hypothetical protein [Candidatus Moduliflexus flocculans]
MLGMLPVAVLGRTSPAPAIPGCGRIYPLAQGRLSPGPGASSGYELSYVVLYYLPWESVFRGRPVLPARPGRRARPRPGRPDRGGDPPPHRPPRQGDRRGRGCPGPVFGLLAYSTGSFLDPLVLHATAGVVADTALCRRRRRENR